MAEILSAVRDWIKAAPCIEKKNKFYLSYIAANKPDAYCIEKSGSSTRRDITGKVSSWTQNISFYWNSVYGAENANNIQAQKFAQTLADWVEEQVRACKYPIVDGYTVDSVAVTNTGILAETHTNIGIYEMQFRFELSEV